MGDFSKFIYILLSHYCPSILLFDLIFLFFCLLDRCQGKARLPRLSFQSISSHYDSTE